MLFYEIIMKKMNLEDKKREKLRVKMVELQQEAQKYRQQIEVIDAKKEESRRDAVIGKCYKKVDDSDKTTFIRVDFFNKSYEPMGIELSYYGKTWDTQYWNIRINTEIWWDDVEKGKQIPNSKFNGIIARAKGHIMETKAPSKNIQAKHYIKK